MQTAMPTSCDVPYYQGTHHTGPLAQWVRSGLAADCLLNVHVCILYLQMKVGPLFVLLLNTAVGVGRASELQAEPHNGNVSPTGRIC